MFWKLTSLSACSPVEAVLDKENFTLEELLDEEEIIQECKALNSRLINFLRDRSQIEQLLHYIVDEPSEDADNKRKFKFPFLASEIFTCEIDVILKTLVEEEELMKLLFSFLKPSCPHSALLAGYFSKVVICLMLRKTVPLMNYVQSPPKVHANAAEMLCAITRNTPSPLATKLSSPSFVARIFGHAFEDSHSKSALVNSLAVCISLLDSKRSMPSFMMYSFRSQHVYESPVHVSLDTIGAMLPKLGDLVKLLNVTSDEKILPTTYGELRPPLGKHRLKIVEFFSVLLKAGNEAAEKELISSGAIERVLDLFFEYPYNNALHHHVESIIISCMESKNKIIVDHLFEECDLIGKILQTDKQSTISSDEKQPTFANSAKRAPRVGSIGHITRISNKLVQLGKNDNYIQAHIEKNMEWSDWQTTVLQERNTIENVYRWACGRPTALHDRMRDSDEEDVHDRDYDVAALANNFSQAFRYTIYDNDDAEEGHTALERDDEDVYFDDGSAEVVISSLRLGDDQGSSLFTNSNWFAFQDDRLGDAPVNTSSTEAMEEVNLNGTSNGGNCNSDEEVVVGEEDGLAESRNSTDGTPTSSANAFSGSNSVNGVSFNQQNYKAGPSDDMAFFHFETTDNDDPFGDRPMPEWAAWGNASDFQVGRSNVNPFEDPSNSSGHLANSVEVATPVVSFTFGGSEESIQNGVSTSPDSSKRSPGSESSHKEAAVPSMFEEDVEFVGVELEGSEKAMEHALKEGIVGEAAPLKKSVAPKSPEKESTDNGGAGVKEYNDANYWRVDQEVAVLE
ncbi:serine/threonine-protein phosphatase 6 regulatory subunit 3-like isoform X3 [Solanum pennellii]|uniref:Serine/threonine-protein phosphatase 6 regulatory subunit 3-like isoform X3 n=1 Tax=Solanum pennellii TaxID=28526 RepID=A0ABM1VCA9_SOLPN|nr:serine/threonine-protein phosphatase 6 regulatory subunit 3-like isoform X3 [Solanum pennellii]